MLKNSIRTAFQKALTNLFYFFISFFAVSTFAGNQSFISNTIADHIPVKITHVGNSITFGFENKEKNAYPTTVIWNDCRDRIPQLESIEIYVTTKGVSGNTGDANSPFGTIELAIKKAKEIRQNNKLTPINIHISVGEYYLDSPIRLSSELSHIKLIGEGSDKVIVKGSKRMKLNWTKHKNLIWVAKVIDTAHFDQIFVNQKQQILARYPNYNENGGHWQGHAEDAISKERVKTWKNPKGAIVHAMHSGEWGDFHYVISEVKKNGKVGLSGGHQNNRPSPLHKTYRMVENVLEELDSPGEWYFDNVKELLYYWPENGIDLKNTIVEGVYLKSLIKIVGDKSKPVQNVSIEGIKFEHTQRTFMEDYEPLLRSDWTIYSGGAIFIERTENVNIKNCEFVNLGGNVIFVSKYNRKVQISGNHIHECGASGICFVGNSSAVRSPSFQYRKFIPLDDMDTVSGPANNDYPSESKISNNLIYRTGRIEKQTAGVQISMAMDITVSHNSIYDVPRAGINISDGTWGGHIIEFNDVFNTVLESSDHGAFNSWGRDRFWHPNRSTMEKLTTNNPEMQRWDAIHTTIIRNNRFRCDHGWDIDLDDGSSNYHLYNNVCLNGGIKLREGFYRKVENNIMINNSFHPHVWFVNSNDIFRRNIVLTAYKDIRLSGWGKEVDHNLFPDKEALFYAQTKGVDAHSIFGNPEFIAPERGDYRVSENSPALKIGFINFPMDEFGVQIPALKSISKKPEIPSLWSLSDQNKKENMEMIWLGAKIKNIETMAERSASGLNKTSGVLIVEINQESVISASDLIVGDVIIGGEGIEINSINDLMQVFQGINWKGKMNLDVFRNQKKIKLIINTK